MDDHPKPSAVLVAVLVAVATIGAAVALVGSGGSDEGSPATCGEIVGVNGRAYSRDTINDDVLPVGELGDVIGVVDRRWACDDSGLDRPIPDDVIVASLLTPGTELRSIGTGPASGTIAAVSDGQVVVYQAVDVDPLSFTAEVSEIGINSAYDGTTRFATVADRSMIAALMEAARSSPHFSRREDDTDLDDRRYFVELVRTDGLRTVIPYWIDERILGDRIVADTWATAVAAALVESPNQPVVDGVTLTDGDRAASFHRNGGCRQDRPDLEVEPNEALTFDIDPPLQLSFVFVTSQPLDPSSADPSDAFAPAVAATFKVPDNEGTLIVEATLTRADGTTVDTCTALRVIAAAFPS